MAKPIATPTAFAPLAPPWSLVSLDANFTNQNNALNDYSLYSNYLADTSGVANAITVTTPAGTAFAYAAGIQVQIKVAVTNTSGTVNINVNSLGNQLVKNPDGSSATIGQLVGGGIYVFQYDGTNFQIAGAVSGFTGFANPSASVGLAAINGTATTALRSDGAPALDQSIAPTWTGNHLFRTASATGTEGLKLDNAAGDARFGLYSAGTEYGLVQVTTNTLALSAIGAATTLKLAVNAGTAVSITAAGAITANAPSQNRAFTFPTAGYTFGNTTDNPTYTFAGSGATTFGGTISASNFTGFANPTASVGLAIINGAATTAMRSDGAPALSQSIAPTWTGNHLFRTASASGTEGMQLDNSAGDARFGLYSAGTEYGTVQVTTNTLSFSAVGASTTLKLNVNAGTAVSIAATGAVTVNAPSSGVAVAVTANASSAALTVTGAGAGVEVLKVDDNAGDTRIGLYSAATEYGTVQATTNTLTLSAIGASTTLKLATNAGARFQITAAGVISGFGPVAGAMVDMNPDKGSFTGTFTGFTAGVTATVTWVRVGNLVIMSLPYTGANTSNAASFTMTGIPASIQPVTGATVGLLGVCTDNSVQQSLPSTFSITGGTMTFYKNGSYGNVNGWTNSGTKAIGSSVDSAAQFIYYGLN